MAYAAALSLKDVLDQLAHFSNGFANVQCPESLLPSIERLYEMVCSIQALDFEDYRPLPGGEYLEIEIRDALWRAEDIVESYILIMTRFLSSESESHALNFSQDILEVVEKIKSGMKRMKKFLNELKQGKDDSVSSAVSLISSSYLPPECKKNKMVGINEELEEIKHIMFFETAQPSLGAFVIHGMAGIGKTSLAVLFYNDYFVRNRFSLRAWVKISLEHCVRDILLSLLHTLELFGWDKLSKSVIEKLVEENDDEGLANFVRERLEQNRHLVVVDCLSEMNMSSWDYIKTLLPNSNNGSRIILVNRWKLQDDDFVFYCHSKRFLSVPQSWYLLREQVFGNEPCPSIALERMGQTIAKNCRGLPLAIITTGLHLAKEQKTVEYWNKIAESDNSLAYAADGAHMFQQLWLSYKQLPQPLRPILLYMVAFPERHGIPIGEHQNLWVAEGFVAREDHGNYKELTDGMVEYFEARNLIFFHESACFLHHAMWHFCCEQARKEKFFHVMDKCIIDEWEENINNNNIRRLIIRNNALLGVSDFHRFEHSVHSTIRSLLLIAPYHLYPLRILWGSYKMLRVLHALTIRLYEFPDEILHLTLLRHLTVTLNGGELPPGISKLTNLQFLNVFFHQIVRSTGGAPTYLPIEIWEMQQLIHLQVMGSDLPSPPVDSDALLPNLVRLLGVTPHSSTKEILERIPNLTYLAIKIFLAPTNGEVTPLCPFNHLSLLKQLETLICTVNTPYFECSPAQPQVAAMPESFSSSMNSLTGLSLCGCGYPWESIKHISQLPFLEHLYLQCHAFRGPQWKLMNEEFDRLKSLILEDLDLVYWTASRKFLPSLETLTIRRCHKLQRLPHGFVHCRDLHMVEVVDNSSAVDTWARSLQVERNRTGNLLWLKISSPRGASSL